ncbi:MAG TPA: hypothetical protein VIY51_04365 [Xanthobacteraceae bacterium]
MTLAELKRSVSKGKPPAGLAPALAALWWEAKGDWERAHALIMDEGGKDCAWVHAYLHRREGDLGNARYWYGKAGKAAPSGPLRTEWDRIAQALLGLADPG